MNVRMEQQGKLLTEIRIEHNKELRTLFHKTFITLQPSKTSSHIQHITIFSLLANPKGFGALAPSMRECAQKFQQGKRTYK